MRIIIDDDGAISCRVSDFTDSYGKYYRNGNPILYGNLDKKDQDLVRLLVGNVLYNLL
jgi:hypothetical protein